MTNERGKAIAVAGARVTSAVLMGGCSARTEPGAHDASARAPVRARPSAAQVTDDAGATLTDVATRQRVELVWSGGPYGYDYDWGGGSAEDPSDDDVARIAPSLARELRRYPEGFLRRAGLDAIVLVRDLFVREDGGARSAAAYIFEDRLFLDVPLADRAVQAGTRVRFVHHILWHRLDELGGTMWEDPEWEALNLPAVEYGVHSRGGVHETRPGSGSLSADHPGFLNSYSTGNLPDDKAEVFAYLMVVHSWVSERAREDEHLRRKVEAIKARLAAFDASFDEDFWAGVDADSDDAARYGAGR